MYVYTEKDLENIRKEVLEDVQDINQFGCQPRDQVLWLGILHLQVY